MTSDQATAFLSFFLEQIDYEAPITAKVLAAVPEDQGAYKPAEKNMSGLELAAHLATSEQWFVDGIVAGDFNVPDPSKSLDLSSPSKIAAYYDKFVPEMRSRLQALTPEQLTKPIPFFGMFEMPAVMYLQFLIKHSCHHRGQMSSYLRPMGGKVPSIYGGSADEPMAMPEAASVTNA